MPYPTVTSIALTRYYTNLKTQSIDAYCDVTFSNDVVKEDPIVGIPLAAVQAVATAAGRADIIAADVATVCGTAIPDLAPATVTVYAPS